MSSAAAVPVPGFPGGFAGALAEAGAAIGVLAGQPLWAVGDAGLLAAVAELTAATARLDAVRLAVIAEVESRGAALATGAPSTTAWLRGALRMAPGAAAAQCRLAVRLADPALGPTADALAGGTINLAHAAVIARTLDSLPDTLDPGTLGEAQTTLLDHAGSLDPTQLRHTAVHLRAVLDPTTLDALARREFDQAQHRTLTLSPTGDGWVLIRGQLDTEAATQLSAAIGALAAPRPSTEHGPDPRLAAHRRADALIELARRALTAGDLPTTHGGQRPAVVVTVTLDTLRNGIGAAHLAGNHTTAQPISPTTARRIACDAAIIPALLASPSQPLDLGRSTRTVNPALYRALVLRDQGCAFPHCNRPPEWTEAHHIQHWADGGTTALINLCLLCAHHHQTVHLQGWRITIDHQGKPHFTAP